MLSEMKHFFTIALIILWVFIMGACQKNFSEKISKTKITEKNESQEICFVDTVYTDVIKKHANIDMPGKVLDTNGKLLDARRLHSITFTSLSFAIN